MTYKTFSVGDVLTALDVQTIQDQSVIRVASAAERDAIPSPVQGMSVYRTDTGRTERYLAAYSAGNPGGASAAGWYPERRMFNAFATAAQVFVANWNLLNAAITEQRNDGLGTFNAGVFTVTAPGEYALEASARITNAVNPYSVQIVKNDTVPDGSGVLAVHLSSASSAGGFPISAVRTLAAGDQIRVFVYGGGTAGNSIATDKGRAGTSFTIEKIG